MSHVKAWGTATNHEIAIAAAPTNGFVPEAQMAGRTLRTPNVPPEETVSHVTDYHLAALGAGALGGPDAPLTQWAQRVNEKNNGEEI
jgi:hypothetical protein